MLAEETSRTNDVQSLQRDIPKMTEAAELRMRLWAEGRLQSERATTEGVLERTQAESGMVRALLDEAVSAISKELNMQKVEWKARSVALEDLLDELVSGLEARLTEVDNGAAKKRRLGDLTKETGARIGEIERRVRQVRAFLSFKRTTSLHEPLLFPSCISSRHWEEASLYVPGIMFQPQESIGIDRPRQTCRLFRSSL